MKKKKQMHTIGLLHNPKIPESQSLASEIAHYIESHGLSVRLGSILDDEENNCFLNSSDMLIVLGGDGTVLRAAHLVKSSKVPILGINLGHLGFLTEIKGDCWQDELSLVLSEKYWIEERTMLHAELNRNGKKEAGCEALNDVVISRGRRICIMKSTVHVNGEYLTTYPGDGIIVSTPTGSTAYAWDIGGPVLSPCLKGILLIPMSPHLYMNRTLVLEQEAKIRVEISTEDQGMLTMDGRIEVDLQDGDCVTIQASPCVTHFVRLHSKMYYLHRLKSIPILI